MLDEASKAGISNQDIARGLGVSVRSVNRWSDGINYPHPIMQQAVIKYLQRKLNAEVK